MSELTQDEINNLKVFEKIFEKCKEKGAIFTPEQQNKIKDNLTKTLSSLGEEYLASQEAAIKDSLVNKLVEANKRPWFQRLFNLNNLTENKLSKLGAELEKEEMPKAIAASKKIIESQLRKFSMKDTVFDQNIQNYLPSNDPNKGFKVSIDTAAIIRMKNPKEFDRITFPPKTVAKPKNPSVKVTEKTKAVAKVEKQSKDKSKARGR